MIDTRPIEPVVAAALRRAAFSSSADFTQLESLLGTFGTPLAITRLGDLEDFDELILLSDGAQHGVLAYSLLDNLGRIYWGSSEELLEYFFGPDSSLYWQDPFGAQRFLTTALDRFPVVSA
jgi:hypothetical protein